MKKKNIYYLYFFSGRNRQQTFSDPKAAFICCKELPLEKIDEESDNIDVFSLGQRCLVLDAGGKSQAQPL